MIKRMSWKQTMIVIGLKIKFITQIDLMKKILEDSNIKDILITLKLTQRKLLMIKNSKLVFTVSLNIENHVN